MHALWQGISGTLDKLKESQKSQETMKGEWPEMRQVGRHLTNQRLYKQVLHTSDVLESEEGIR